MIQKAYKIMLRKDDKLKNLFKGINRNRTLLPNRWYEAEIRWGRDGGNDRYYVTGIHVLPTKEQAEDYLDNFRTEKDRVIIECYVAGDRRKPTNQDVILARKIFIPEESYQKHVS
jgi:hypothetical protein